MKREPTYGQHGSYKKQRAVNMRSYRIKKRAQKRRWAKRMIIKGRKTNYR